MQWIVSNRVPGKNSSQTCFIIVDFQERGKCGENSGEYSRSTSSSRSKRSRERLKAFGSEKNFRSGSNKLVELSILKTSWKKGLYEINRHTKKYQIWTNWVKSFWFREELSKWEQQTWILLESFLSWKQGRRKGYMDGFTKMKLLGIPYQIWTNWVKSFWLR